MEIQAFAYLECRAVERFVSTVQPSVIRGYSADSEQKDTVCDLILCETRRRADGGCGLGYLRHRVRYHASFLGPSLTSPIAFLCFCTLIPLFEFLS